MAKMEETKQTMTNNEHFGLSIGKSLDALNPSGQAWAKMKIQEIMYNAEHSNQFLGGVSNEYHHL
jgi:hypothetical protein